jgi:shikimate 5-dehydrogenase
VTDRLHFIGVSTEGSSIFTLFPIWAGILGIEAGIEGRDIPLGAPAEAFRAAVAEIGTEDRVRGALVTAHKVDVVRYAGDLFGELDRFARLCREVSCVSKRDGVLFGHAKDPITAGLALDHMLGRDYWRGRRAHVLCLGAGGAGTAITVRLSSEPTGPERIVVTDTSEGRLAELRAVHAELGAAGVEYRQVSSPAETDQLLGQLPAGSLVVNATGLGKDAPGSPLSAEALFPAEAVVWELNYRGELDFLRQALDQAGERALVVHDGWRYFLHGWTEVIAEVFGLELSPERFAELTDAAEPYRPTPLA